MGEQRLAAMIKIETSPFWGKFEDKWYPIIAQFTSEMVFFLLPQKCKLLDDTKNKIQLKSAESANESR